MSPKLSIGGKGPADAKPGFNCIKCTKVFATKTGLRDHGVREHNFDYATGEPPTAEIIAAVQKRHSKKQRKSKDTTEVSNLEQDMFISVSESGSDKSNVEPEDEEQRESVKKKFESKETTDAPLGASMPPGSQPRNETLKTLTPEPGTARSRIGWSLEPRALSDTTDPCERKKFADRSKVICPPARAASSSSSRSPPAQRKVKAPSTSVRKGPQEWPNRAVTPSVRDLTAFRRTLPATLTPTETAERISEMFGWDNSLTVTSEQYAKGVIAGYDMGRRQLLDGLDQLLKDVPSTPEAAQLRWQWLQQWSQQQDRPATPKQSFDD